MTPFILAIPLVLFLPLVVVLHRIGQKKAERRAGHVVPTQGIALKAVLLAIFVMLSVIGFICWGTGLALAWGLWAGIVLGGLAYCYWSLICLTESGRRYMIVELVAANPGITAMQIVNQYNRKQIIAVRLDRLEHWGTLRRDGNRYKPRATFMLTASGLVQRWASLLGFEWSRSFDHPHNN
jgi:hypothetical protein